MWLTNPMYGDVPDPESNPGCRASQTDDAPNETPRAVRRAPGSAEVVPESPAILRVPEPFEDEAEGAGEGVRGRGCACLPGGARAGRRRGRRVPDDSRRPMSPDANSIPLPSRSLLGANGANGRPGSGESRLNRVSRRYSHELEDAGTRRTLFDESRTLTEAEGIDEASTTTTTTTRVSTTIGPGTGRTVTTTEPAAEPEAEGMPNRRGESVERNGQRPVRRAAGTADACTRPRRRRRGLNRERPGSIARVLPPPRTPPPPRRGGSTRGSSTTRSRGRARRPETETEYRPE